MTWAQKMAARQAAGKCRQCGAPQVPGRVLCELHLIAQRERKRARDAARKGAGLCVEGGCERAQSDGHIRCAECHERFSTFNLEWQREHRVKGPQT